MRFLIAGGAGFVGSHISERLLSLGHSVVCVDNFLTGVPRNIQRLMGASGFETVCQDISEPFDFEGAFDGVLHLATPASPLAYQRHPIDTLKAGANGTFNLLELAGAKHARFLLTSTSEVYGNPEVHPQVEEYHGRVSPTGPRSMYDEAKRFSEAATMGYHRAYGADVGIVRIFNTYGPRMRPDDGRVIPTFVSQALRGEPLSLFGKGLQTRSFCYIDDLVEGLVRMLFSSETGPINLGNPDEVTMLALAGKILAVSGSKSSIEFKPLPVDDPVRRKPDITKARKLLGWEPKVTLDEGLERTIASVRSELDIPETVA